MYFQPDNHHAYILRLNRGEQVIASLKKFCQQQMIGGGFFYGLGAVDQVELALYNVETKDYNKQQFAEPLEVANITGSIAMDQGQVLIHAHTVLGRSDMTSLAGHLVEMKVSGTLELLLHATQPLVKEDDPQTGLKIF